MDLHKLFNNITATSNLSGGSICQAQLSTTTNGDKYVYKQLKQAPKDFFLQEKTGLETLAKSRIFSTPEVYATTEKDILLEYIKPTATSKKQSKSPI